MIKNLVKHGNRWALVIDKPILDLLKIDPASPVKLITDGRAVTITPTADAHQKKVRAAREKVNDRHFHRSSMNDASTEFNTYEFARNSEGVMLTADRKARVKAL